MTCHHIVQKESLLWWPFKSLWMQGICPRANLDANMKECIYLGLARGEFGFRLWDPIIV